MNSFGLGNVSVQVKDPSKMTVEELRKSGFKVRVYHGRVVFLGMSVDIMSRREFETKMPSDMWDGLVLSSGGFTRVEVTTPEGETKVGKFNFGNRQFNRKLGLTAAIGRALCKRK